MTKKGSKKKGKQALNEFTIPENTFNVIFRYGGELERTVDGVEISYVHGDSTIRIFDNKKSYGDFLDFVESLCNAPRTTWSLRVVVNNNPTRVECEGQYTTVIEYIIKSGAMVISVWVVDHLKPVIVSAALTRQVSERPQISQYLRRKLFPEHVPQNQNVGTKPNYAAFRTPTKPFDVPDEYRLETSSQDPCLPLRTMGEGHSNDPVVLETPSPNVQMTSGVYIPVSPVYNTPKNGRMLPSSITSPLSARSGSLAEVAGILSVMHRDSGFWASKDMQEEVRLNAGDEGIEPAVRLGDDNDYAESEDTEWDLEEDVFDTNSDYSYNSYDRLEDELEEEMVNDSNPMFGTQALNTQEQQLEDELLNDNSHLSNSPSVNTQDQELEDEMFNDSCPMFGTTTLNTQERELEDELCNETRVLNSQEQQREQRFNVEDKTSNVADVSCNLEDRFVLIGDYVNNAPGQNSVPLEQNPPPQRSVPFPSDVPLQKNVRVEENRDNDEVKRELENIFSSYVATNRANVGCAPHTEPFHDDYVRPACGVVYLSRSDLERDIQTYAIKTDKDLRRESTTSKRLIWKCRASGCLWRVYATPNMNGTWQIRRMVDDHSCGNFRVGGKNPQANSDWVSRVCMRKLKDNPNLKPKTLVKILQEEYMTTVSYKIAWAAKDKAMMKIRGSYSYSYQMLETYSKEPVKVDPEAVTEILTGPDDRFKYFFWTYGLSIRTYKAHLRPVVIVDGTFLKGRYPRTILSAIAVDGNNHIFPLAFAIVMKEKNESWDWFFSKLRDHVVGENHEFILLSDRHKSIIQAVPKILPKAVHIFCCYHMSNKFGHKKIKFLVQEAAQTLIQEDFWGYMLGIWAISSKAHEKLMDVEPLDKWASAFQEISRFGISTTNHVESWNKMIIGERMLPVTTIVSMIRENVIRHYRDYRNDSLKFDSPVTSWCKDQIIHNAFVGRWCTVESHSAGRWTVNGIKRSCVVNLNERTCTCRWFQVMGIPCAHAMAAIRDVGFDPYKFVDVYYLKETYIATYREEWIPIRGKEEWPTDRPTKKILPPLKSAMPGRPQTKRKRGKAEGVPTQSRRCSRCRVRGHNKSTCTECIDDFILFSHTLFGEGPPRSPIPATI